MPTAHKRREALSRRDRTACPHRAHLKRQSGHDLPASPNRDTPAGRSLPGRAEFSAAGAAIRRGMVGAAGLLSSRKMLPGDRQQGFLIDCAGRFHSVDDGVDGPLAILVARVFTDMPVTSHGRSHRPVRPTYHNRQRAALDGRSRMHAVHMDNAQGGLTVASDRRADCRCGLLSA